MKESAEEENSSRKERREVEGEKIAVRKGSLEEGKIKERSLVRNRMKGMKVN
jgi:hypothetical protein